MQKHVFTEFYFFLIIRAYLLNEAFLKSCDMKIRM